MKKNMFYVAMIILVALFLHACGTSQTAAEKEQQAAEVNEAIMNSDFTFKARFAYPTGFKSLYLPPSYDVVVSSDTVKAYLPFYGRAYRAPIDPRDGGYRFTSTDFEYLISPGKNDRNWIVKIIFNDLDRALEFQFDIWTNGSAYLSVNDMDRQAISYQGDIVIND